MKYIFILLLTFNFLINGNANILVDNGNTHSEWKLAKNQKNIKVFIRQSENSNIKEFKATTTVVANIKTLESILDNVSEYPNWIANIESVKVLKQVNKNDKYIYYITKVPWPISSRDMILKSIKSTNNNGVLSYNLSGYPEYIDKHKDYIRIIDALGKWEFTPIEDGKIEITYKFYADPAGSLPNWVINMFIVDGPYETLTNLKELLGN